MSLESSTPERSTPPHVIVVGGGFTGLLTAWRLAQSGARVTVVEASDRLGGQIHTLDLLGSHVDVGAEAMHLAAPQVGALIDELELRAELITANPGSSWLALPQGLRPLPAGIGPAGPTRIQPVLTSRTLGWRSLARAGLEPLLARLSGGLNLSPGHDISVGDFTTARFGRDVTDAFIDPLLGSLHAGDVHRLSLRACTPTLVPAATSGTPLLKLRRPVLKVQSTRRESAAPTPVMSFVTWPQGLSAIIDRLTARCREAGVEIRLNAPVESLVREPGHGAVVLPDGNSLSADGVVLAIPARVAGHLLGDTGLRATETASVATVLLGFSISDLAGQPVLKGTGILVPSRHGGLLKAVTFLGTKWPHLIPRHSEVWWMRASVGRAGQDRHGHLSDDELVTRVMQDLTQLTGITATPTFTHVRRWPHAMPQLTVGHVDRLATLRGTLAAAPGLPIAVAGASYDGIGLASCITSAKNAAALLLKRIETQQ